MAFYTDLANVHKNRPVKPIYAWTQATPQSWTLADSVTDDIFPGEVMSFAGAGTVVPCTDTTAPAGICSTFQNELTVSGSREVAVWVLGPDAVMEVAMTAVDDKADWAGALATIKAGGTVNVICNKDHKLSLAAAAKEGETPAATPAVARLIDVIGTNYIHIAGLL